MWNQINYHQNLLQFLHQTNYIEAKVIRDSNFVKVIRFNFACYFDSSNYSKLKNLLSNYSFHYFFTSNLQNFDKYFTITNFLFIVKINFIHLQVTNTINFT